MEITTQQNGQLPEDFFQRPELYEAWARVVNGDIRRMLAPLTSGRKHGGKMLWAIVIKESQRLGILKNNLGHLEAASLLAAVCPGCFESVESLKNSIDTFYKEAWHEVSHERSLEFGPPIRELLRVIAPPPPQATHLEAPLEDFAFDIANQLVDYEFNRKSSIVRRRPEYVADIHRVTPAVSIETFPDPEAFEANMPTSVISFECVDDGVSDARVEMWHSQYGHFGGRHHVVIVTRHGFKSERAEQLCRAYNMGLWRVNDNGTFNRILSRSVNDFEALQSARLALFGGPQTAHDVVYANGEFMTLPELLVDWGARVKPGCILKAPYYNKEQIKAIATEHLKLIGYNHNGYTVTNIERLADALGFQWSWGQLMPYQLGVCDFDGNRIIISDTLRRYPHRFRFVFCHDGGHIVLQKDSVVPFVTSLGESQQTLFTCNFRREQLRWMEWQANQYSRYLLMPDDIMSNLVNTCYDERMLRTGYLYVDDQVCNQVSFKNVLYNMSRLANVSMQALTYRLQEMELLKDERNPQSLGALL